MNIAVFGARGRVGSAVCKIAKARGHVVWEIERETDLNTVQDADVAIDFSTADATEKVCEFCQMHRLPLVTGVTGRTEAQNAILQDTSKYVKVVEKANFSKGVDMTYRICRLLAELGWDCDIVETHRKQKTDCPSGTAKQLAYEISSHGTRNVVLHSIRAGSNFGKHEVIFATEGESICVTHQAENVNVFALGAVECAEKLVNTS